MKWTICLAAAVFCGAASADEEWPLVVIRHTGNLNENPKVFERLMECHFRHPGACDEFWFAGGGRNTPEMLAAVAARIAAFRPLCEKAGIALSYQQGTTLGHGAAHDGPPKPGEQAFPEDAWQIDRSGKKLGILCPRSPAVLEFERMYVKTMLQGMKPASYWLDDDLRLGISHAEGCFCPRCIEAFNKKTGGSWTRETLVAKLFSKTVREPVRAQWLAFNSESLAMFAAEARKAADEACSGVRLAYQAVWSDTIYTGRDFRPLLEALSGPGRRPVGIRPGAGFYTEAQPRDMVKKCLSVAREAERCRGYGALVGTVCYEQETYPRYVLHKSPGAIMTECALALASGCNSLSLYWYSHAAPEPIEEYDRFVRTLAAARPYFRRLADSTRRTRLGGVARFVGSAAAETAGFDLRDNADFDLACAGVPVTVAESGTKVWYITGKSRSEMTEADKAAVASGAVVSLDGIGKFPRAGRRKKLLDDLDAATKGAFPVRIDECRALRILPRVREDGTLDSVTILNLSIGDTDEMVVRVRNPAAGRAFWQDAKLSAPVPVDILPGASANERVVKISNLAGWQIGTIFFETPDTRRR